MVLPIVLQTDHLIRTRDRYSALHHRVLNGAGVLFLAFCFIMFASFTCFSRFLSPNSPPNSFPFRVFYLLDGFAFFSSLSGLLVAASQAVSAMSHPHPALLASIDEEVAAQRRCLAADLPRVAYGVIFLTLAVSFFAGAFVFAGLTTQQDMKSLLVPVILPAAVGGIVLVQALLLIGREIVLVWFRISVFDVQLWNAMKKETMFGYLVAKYVTSFERKRERSTEQTPDVETL